jgi:hypothetical protein
VNGSSADLDRFQDWGLDAARWAKHAQFLKRSADLMWAPIDRAYDSLSDSVESNQAFEAGAFEDLKHSYGYLLLVGAAVETMLKAAAIQRVLNTDGRRSLLSEDGHRLQRWLRRSNRTGWRLAAKSSKQCSGPAGYSKRRHVEGQPFLGCHGRRSRFTCAAAHAPRTATSASRSAIGLAAVSGRRGRRTPRARCLASRRTSGRPWLWA